MRCELAERELSARLDGDRDGRADGPLEEHLATCARCRAFDARTRRLRDVARIEPAAPVPDLVPVIMERVLREAPARRLPPRLALRPTPAWGSYTAAFVAGAVAAALVLGGLPTLLRSPQPALAVEIPRRIAAASNEISAYQAVFRILERNYHPEVRVRRFSATVTFRAPEGFRAEVRDRSRYPEGPWPRNDLVLAVDGDRWMAEGPVTCPRQALPVCGIERRERRAVRNREPFDATTPLPTDIVLPVRTLAGSERVRVVGQGTVLGRRVVTIELPYRDATPLFAYLQSAGSWRPLYPQDRVLVSLDAETWFPLAYDVWPAAGAERALWAVRNGLPPEDPAVAVFRAEAISFQDQEPPGWSPQASVRPAGDRGFRDLPFASVAAVAGVRPVVPSYVAGLRPYRAGTYEDGGRATGEVLLSYAEGLSWLKVRETRRWAGPTLFGDVGPLAAPVSLPGGAVAYYEPATAALGRRVSIHGPGWDLYLESNLPRDELLRVAASLPVLGQPAPEEWRVRRLPGGTVRQQVSVDAVVAEGPWVLLPDRLPAGFRASTAEVVRSGDRTAVTVYFRRPGTELDGIGIRLHQAPGTPLPPPMDPDVLAVRVRGTTGRYSPTRGELEWVEEGVYRSLGGTALDLAGLLRVAESLGAP